MRRSLAATFAALAIGVLAGACDDGGYRHHGAFTRENPHCGQYATCGTCTPTLGCGWCFTGTSGGLCVEDPGDCPSATTTNWTWDPPGCSSETAGDGGRGDAGYVAADASLAAGDAGPSDAGGSDAAQDTGVIR